MTLWTKSGSWSNFYAIEKASAKDLSYVTTAVFDPLTLFPNHIFWVFQKMAGIPEITALWRKKKPSTILEVYHLWVKEESELSVLRAFCLDDSCQTTLPEERPWTPRFIFPGSTSCLLIYTGCGNFWPRAGWGWASRTLSRPPACNKAHLSGWFLSFSTVNNFRNRFQ